MYSVKQRINNIKQPRGGYTDLVSSGDGDFLIHEKTKYII